MPIKVTVFAADDAERRALEQTLLTSRGGTLAGPALLRPRSFDPGELLPVLESQAPETILVSLPSSVASEISLACGFIAWLREIRPQAMVMAIGPLDTPSLIVSAMRAGACEYLEKPLRGEALDEALARAAGPRQALMRPAARGKLLVVVGARGGCGATTVAVNLAVALQIQQRQGDPSVLLLDAAPLGHTALHLNLKPQFNLTDLLHRSTRLDASLLQSLVCRHDCGLDVLAGAPAPLAVGPDAEGGSDPSAWLDILLGQHRWVVADLSTRMDALARAILDRGDRVLLVTQPDMVSLWSAAKVRLHLDPDALRRFDLILNRATAGPSVDDAEVANLTQTQLLWKLPHAPAPALEEVECGEPPALGRRSELARNFREMAAQFLGRPAVRRSWLPFLHPRETQA